MNSRREFLAFLFLFLASVFLGYAKFLESEQSLYLAYFDDPTPRWGFYPWLLQSTRQLSDNHFPLWNNLEGAGLPLLANYQSSPFNPFNLIWGIFPTLKWLDFILILKLVLLGIFTYAFAINLGLSSLSAGNCVLVICFSGFVSKSINHYNLGTDLWLPAGLVLVEKIFKTGVSRLKFIALSLITALGLLGGNPQAVFYFLFFLLGYSLFRGGWLKKKELLAIILGIALGLALCSVQLLSFMEYLGVSWHYHNRPVVSIDYVPIRWGFSLFFPWLFGVGFNHPNKASLLSYLGALPVFLAFLTLPKIKSLSRPGLFFWVYGLVFLGMIYQLPPFSLLSYFPIISQIRNPRNAYFGVCFSLALLSGFGMEFFIKRKISRKNYIFSSGVILALMILSLALAFLFPIRIPALPIISKAWLIPLLLFLLAGVSGILGMRFLSMKWTGFLLSFFTWLNLIYLGYGLKPYAEIAPEIFRYQNPEPPPLFTAIAPEMAPVRIIGLGSVLKPYSTLFQLNDFKAFDGIYPLSYAQTIAKIEGIKMEKLVDSYISRGWHFELSAENLDHPLIDQLGITYLISDKMLTVKGWEMVSRTQDYFLYQNQHAWQRVWIKSEAGEIIFGNAELAIYQPDFVKVALNSMNQGELILSDQFFPGWRAWAMPSKRELKISQEPPLFRRVRLEPEDESIVFFYQPWAFRIGLFASLVSGLFILLGFALGLAQKILFRNS